MTDLTRVFPFLTDERYTGQRFTEEVINTLQKV